MKEESEKKRLDKKRWKTKTHGQIYEEETIRGVKVKWAMIPNSKARHNNLKNVTNLMNKTNIGLADLINSKLGYYYTVNTIKDYFYTAQDMVQTTALKEVSK